jgi:hypothetical protein
VPYSWDIVHVLEKHVFLLDAALYRPTAGDFRVIFKTNEHINAVHRRPYADMILRRVSLKCDRTKRCITFKGRFRALPIVGAKVQDVRVLNRNESFSLRINAKGESSARHS